MCKKACQTCEFECLIDKRALSVIKNSAQAIEEIGLLSEVDSVRQKTVKIIRPIFAVFVLGVVPEWHDDRGFHDRWARPVWFSIHPIFPQNFFIVK